MEDNVVQEQGHYVPASAPNTTSPSIHQPPKHSLTVARNGSSVILQLGAIDKATVDRAKALLQCAGPPGSTHQFFLKLHFNNKVAKHEDVKYLVSVMIEHAPVLKGVTINQVRDMNLLTIHEQCVKNKARLVGHPILFFEEVAICMGKELPGNSNTTSWVLSHVEQTVVVLTLGHTGVTRTQESHEVAMGSIDKSFIRTGDQRHMFPRLQALVLESFGSKRLAELFHLFEFVLRRLGIQCFVVCTPDVPSRIPYHMPAFIDMVQTTRGIQAQVLVAEDGTIKSSVELFCGAANKRRLTVTSTAMANQAIPRVGVIFNPADVQIRQPVALRLDISGQHRVSVFDSSDFLLSLSSVTRLEVTASPQNALAVGTFLRDLGNHALSIQEFSLRFVPLPTPLDIVGLPQTLVACMAKIPSGTNGFALSKLALPTIFGLMGDFDSFARCAETVAFTDISE